VQPILDFAGFDLPAYRTFTILALFVGFGVAVVVAVRRGISARTACGVAVAAIVGGLVGGRLFAAATAAEPFWGDAGAVFELRFGSMAMFGGLLGAAAAGTVAARTLGVSPFRFGDAAAPALGIGIALLRVGCLLAGDCFGKGTGLFWGITYPRGSFVHLYQIESGQSILGVLRGTGPVHPIPVYEMLAGLLLASAAVVVIRRGMRDGTALAVVVAGYGLVRLLIEPLRAPEPGSTPAWFDPVVFTTAALFAIIWLAWPHLVERRYAKRSLATA